MRTVVGRLYCLFLCVALTVSVAIAQGKRYEANWESLDKRPTPDWFLDAKFGIFIHWGVYSVPGYGQVGEYAEWYWNRIMGNQAKFAPWREFHKQQYGENFDYMDFAPQFKPNSTTRNSGRTFSNAAARSTSC